MTTKSTKKHDQEVFLKIPKTWTYLVGYEYQAVNRHGDPKLAKGQKPVIKRIDHIDLFLLDEIRGFSERGNMECFEEAVTLAHVVGMVGQERQLCDKILQLCELGFIKAHTKIDDGKVIPKVILEVDSQLVTDAAEARKESILECQRIHSQQASTFTLIREKSMLQEYLQEYLQKQLPEKISEKAQKPAKEELQAKLPVQVHTVDIVPTDKAISDDMSKEYYFLDGKTNDEISAECAIRIKALRETINHAPYSDWSSLLSKAAKIHKGQHGYSSSEIDWAVYLVGAMYQTDTDIAKMVKIVNHLTAIALTDVEYKEYIKDTERFKPMAFSSELPGAVQIGEEAEV